LPIGNTKYYFTIPNIELFIQNFINYEIEYNFNDLILSMVARIIYNDDIYLCELNGVKEITLIFYYY
jgi:hypothetical protein